MFEVGAEDGAKEGNAEGVVDGEDDGESENGQVAVSFQSTSDSVPLPHRSVAFSFGCEPLMAMLILPADFRGPLFENDKDTTPKNASRIY